jgi:hypothetical protein
MVDDLAAHLITLELRLQDPSIRKDRAAIKELLSEDFREFGASGRVWDRVSILAELAVETPHEILSKNFACQQLSDSLALLTYESITSTRTTLRSSLWRLEGDSWRVLFHQGTVAPSD